MNLSNPAVAVNGVFKYYHPGARRCGKNKAGWYNIGFRYVPGIRYRRRNLTGFSDGGNFSKSMKPISEQVEALTIIPALVRFDSSC